MITNSEQEELQRYTAERAYRALDSLLNPHKTLVKLSGYILGEFGHESQQFSTSKQFSLLKKHFHRPECEKCRPALLLAFAKMLHANPDDQTVGQIVSLFEELVDDPDLELQQRAVE